LLEELHKLKVQKRTKTIAQADAVEHEDALELLRQQSFSLRERVRGLERVIEVEKRAELEEMLGRVRSAERDRDRAVREARAMKTGKVDKQLASEQESLKAKNEELEQELLRSNVERFDLKYFSTFSPP